jgi:release factor glutamine methyltransferase
VSIAVNVPDVKILATDISSKALQVAKQNAEKHEVSKNIEFIKCDLLPQQMGPRPTGVHFDLICANLPYIPTETLHNLPIFGREPSLALDGGADGLDLVYRLLKIAPQWLAPNGKMLLEIETTRGIQARNLARDVFPKAVIQLHKDLAGQDRLLEITL